jgi:hypothetical protein
MRLTCQQVFVFAIPLLAACHEATAPPNLISRMYVLASVDGSPLPAIISSGAGDTTHILSSTVILTPKGEALTVNHYRNVYLQYPAGETTDTLTQQYRIKGDSIEIGGFGACEGPVMCASNVHGSISDSAMAIAEWFNPYPTNPIVYVYRRLGDD